MPRELLAELEGPGARVIHQAKTMPSTIIHPITRQGVVRWLTGLYRV